MKQVKYKWRVMPAVIAAMLFCIARPGAAQQTSGVKPVPPSETTGYLGVQVTMLTPELRTFFGAAEDAGILVSKVDDESPALKGGIHVGDVIEKADGKKVASVWMLERLVTQKRAKDLLVVEVLRSKKTKVIKITIEERPRRQLDVGQLFYMQWQKGGQLALDQIDPQTLIYAAEQFRAYFNEPMVLTRMQEMQRLLKREKALQLRIKSLETRIVQLEVLLQE